MNETRQLYYLTLSTVRLSNDLDAPVMAIGACFGSSDGKVLHSRIFCTTPHTDADKEAWRLFWRSQEWIVQRMQNVATENHILAFRTWLVELQATYGFVGRNSTNASAPLLHFVSENPIYDMGGVNSEFVKLGHKKPLALFYDDFVPTDDPKQQMCGLRESARRSVRAAAKCQKSSWPVHMAKRSFQRMCKIHSILEGEDK